MELIRDSGFDELLALCGGARACASCHVYINSDFASLLPVVTGGEDELLNASQNREETSRLSCQIQFDGGLAGLKVTIAPQD
jgi:2Fe-2S ferredoxin